ncbi:MAG: hypothetical protein R3E53_11355 [Myxococcota bacterium]
MRTMKRRIPGVSVLLLAVLALAHAASAHGPTIEITHAEMKPALLNLYVGTTVHFNNTVSMPGGHVVVDESGTLESPPLLEPGDGWHLHVRAGRDVRDLPEAAPEGPRAHRRGAEALGVAVSARCLEWRARGTNARGGHVPHRAFVDPRAAIRARRTRSTGRGR